MISVVLSVGSNCGDRVSLVTEALAWLKNILIQPESSDIYETPCAKIKGRPYINAVIKGFYQGDGFQLQEMLKEKEHEMGRNAQCKEKGEVPIDIDIVVMDGEIIKEWDYRQKFFSIGYSQLSTR